MQRRSNLPFYRSALNPTLQSIALPEEQHEVGDGQQLAKLGVANAMCWTWWQLLFLQQNSFLANNLHVTS